MISEKSSIIDLMACPTASLDKDILLGGAEPPPPYLYKHLSLQSPGEGKRDSARESRAFFRCVESKTLNCYRLFRYPRFKLKLNSLER